MRRALHRLAAAGQPQAQQQVQAQQEEAQAQEQQQAQQLTVAECWLARIMRSPGRLRSRQLRYGHPQLEPIWPQRYCMPDRARLETTAGFLAFAARKLYGADGMIAPPELVTLLARRFNGCIATAAAAAPLASGDALPLAADRPTCLARVERFLQRPWPPAELEARLDALSPQDCALQLGHPHSFVNKEIQAAGMFVAGQAAAYRSPDWWASCPGADAAPDGAGLMMAPLPGALLTAEQRASIVAPCDLMRHVACELADEYRALGYPSAPQLVPEQPPRVEELFSTAQQALAGSGRAGSQLRSTARAGAWAAACASAAVVQANMPPGARSNAALR
eukprot:scaffold2.g7289.t1